MTLRDIFHLVGNEPYWVVVVFTVIPVLALLIGGVSKHEGIYSPWRQIYSGIIYLSCVPGVLAIALTMYLVFFEKKSVLDTDFYIQMLPVISMGLTLYIISRFVDMKMIPGFGKVTSLIMMIAVVFFIMWAMEKTRIILVSFMPFHYVILIFIGLLGVLMTSWNNIFNKK